MHLPRSPHHSPLSKSFRMHGKEGEKPRILGGMLTCWRMEGGAREGRSVQCREGGRAEQEPHGINSHGFNAGRPYWQPGWETGKGKAGGGCQRATAGGDPAREE